MQAALLGKVGSVSNLKIQQVENPKPTGKQVVVKHSSIGISFLDVALCRGQYKSEKLPITLGSEGCGIITQIGEEVRDFKVGEKVAYATAGYGSFAEFRAIDEKFLVAVPNEINDSLVAGSFAKGLMAHALLHRVYFARRAKRILIHSVAGGIGHILCQWAKYLDLEIIGTVGSDNKIDFARSLGCALVINYRKQDFVTEIAKFTNYGGVGVVYESTGKLTIQKSLECLWPMGMCINYGESTGCVEKLDLNELVSNSLFITRPTMALYKSNRTELVMSAAEVFAAIQKNIIKPKVKTYPFSKINEALGEIDSGSNIGSIAINF